MSKEQSGTLGSMIFGSATAAGIGSFLFQALGVFALGLIGAFAGWVFSTLIKPKLDEIIQKRKQKKKEEKSN